MILQKDAALKVIKNPIGEGIIETPPNLGDSLDFSMESEESSQEISSLVDTISSNSTSIHTQQLGFQDEDDVWCLANSPPIFKSPKMDVNTEVASKYCLGEPKEELQWRQPISNGGLRIAVYIDNRLFVSFVLVQAALLLIVLSIKWLQRLTS
ncbi:Hypothetical protein NTJ_04799 [Nesidiocoris tenuis]|uniref:Uncharacterized protein n=1 Tax=Nesidiocoris tenuis TaxID=355587 RepID=A0ABN7AIB0_9HEMI|nr:Hypothetical protein NTJ_04799 [Nesidiocoris tenuis]